MNSVTGGPDGPSVGADLTVVPMRAPHHGDIPHSDMNIASPREGGDTHLNVIDHPVFRVRISGEVVLRSLPGLMSDLSNDLVDDIVAVRPHHAHNIHMALAQLASMTDLVTGDAAQWREALLAIEPDLRAWQVFPKSGEYGFFQPALSDLKSSKTKRSPSDIDLLVLPRNHSVKYEPATGMDIDSWIWTLIALQTGAGYPGRGNYGGFRMNSGQASRSLWAVYDRAWGVGRRILEDAVMIRENRVATAKKFGFAVSSGIRLMWVAPWDGKTMLRAAELDPSVLEICRRVNLQADDKGVFAVVATSDSQRTWLANTKSEQFMRGACGDIWSPVLTDKDGSKCFSMGGRGLPYDLVAYHVIGLPFGANTAVQPAPATRRDVADPILIVAGVANGQGKTEGFYRREITFTAAGNAGASFFDDPTLGETALQMIKDAKHLQSALRRALRTFIGTDVKDPIGERFVGSTSNRIDQIFFDRLLAVHHGPEKARYEWINDLHAIGLDALETIFNQVPVRGLTKTRQVVLAERAFRLEFWYSDKASFRQYLPAEYAKKENEDD